MGTTTHYTVKLPGMQGFMGLAIREVDMHILHFRLSSDTPPPPLINLCLVWLITCGLGYDVSNLHVHS